MPAFFNSGQEILGGLADQFDEFIPDLAGHDGDLPGLGVGPGGGPEGGVDHPVQGCFGRHLGFVHPVAAALVNGFVNVHDYLLRLCGSIAIMRAGR